MGTFHLQYVRAAPGHRTGHAPGHRGCWRRGAVPLGDHLSGRACGAAVRAAYDPAQAPGFRAGHPGAADNHPELPAVGAFRACPAAGHRFGGTVTKRAAAHPAQSGPERFTSPHFAAKHERLAKHACPAKPDRSANVAVPEPEFTGSDRLRKPAPVRQDVRWRAATRRACRTPGRRRQRPLAASEI
jgi:hypothetical protein